MRTLEVSIEFDARYNDTVLSNYWCADIKLFIIYGTNVESSLCKCTIYIIREVSKIWTFTKSSFIANVLCIIEVSCMLIARLSKSQ